jgi:outer membrane protein OmpA-like peptidoglycan-associated protein
VRQRKPDQLAQFLTEHGERRVQIDGFTDSMGTDLYNQDLSQRRADAVKASLMARGDLTNSRRDVSSDANTRVAGLALGQRRDPPGRTLQ